MLDGVAIANDKCFENGCMFPGDPGGAPEEVYNCRCTLLAVVEDAPYENAQRRAKSSGGKGQLIGDMSFREWMDRKAGENRTFKNNVNRGIIESGQRSIDESLYKRVSAQDVEEFQKESGICSLSDYAQINSHKKQTAARAVTSVHIRLGSSIKLCVL